MCPLYHVNGIIRITSSSPCLTSVVKIERSLLKSAWTTASNPPDPQWFILSLGEGETWCLYPTRRKDLGGTLFSLIDVGSAFTACVGFLFFPSYNYKRTGQNEHEASEQGWWRAVEIKYTQHNPGAFGPHASRNLPDPQ
eukprot:1158540-Pelagomonas_calceolata.AAC.1